jgi:hypothetical protein
MLDLQRVFDQSYDIGAYRREIEIWQRSDRASIETRSGRMGRQSAQASTSTRVSLKGRLLTLDAAMLTNHAQFANNPGSHALGRDEAAPEGK